MIQKKKNKAIFLDRDGVINEVIYHKGINKPSSPWKIDEFKFINGIEETLHRFKEKNYKLFIITNQPDIARQNIEKGVTEQINKKIFEKLPIDDIQICPHDDSDKCCCRKPKPGMIMDLAYHYDIDLDKSFLIGDGWKDMNAGSQAGCKTILIQKSYNKEVEADFKVLDLNTAGDIILNEK